jgi:hypothetical protein
MASPYDTRLEGIKQIEDPKRVGRPIFDLTKMLKLFSEK